MSFIIIWKNIKFKIADLRQQNAEIQVSANRTKQKDTLSQTSDTIDMMASPTRAIKKERKMQSRRSQRHTKDTQEENDTR